MLFVQNFWEGELKNLNILTKNGNALLLMSSFSSIGRSCSPSVEIRWSFFCQDASVFYVSDSRMPLS